MGKQSLSHGISDDQVSETSADDDNHSKFRSRRKRRRKRSETYPGERDKKIARENQMLLLKQKRSRLLNRKESSSEDERIVECEESSETDSEASSDESVIVTRKKRKKTGSSIRNVISDDSENDHSNQSSKHVESEDDETCCHKSTRTDYTPSDGEMSWKEREREREKLLADKQAQFDSVETKIEMQDTPHCCTNKLVLDYDVETKQELVTVHSKLSEKLKSHQIEGVKFMWNTCFESVKELQKGPGRGCILAHCMGLGKTLQVITLVHTLLNHENTQVKSVLVLCPVSTILNWVSEFEKWLTDVDDKEINIYNLTKLKKIDMRLESLETWIRNGGVMIIGYEMFRLLCNNPKMKKNIRNKILQTLLHPGCDLIVCDEAHVLKNDKSALTKTVMKIRTRRRVLLTGTPLQNNLMEFYCMVRFANPRLLGSKKNFQNQFGHVITKGQFRDSDSLDVSAMKQCTYVLHKMSSHITQRRDHEILKPYLPPKREFVIIVGLSDIQAKLYQHYLETRSMIASTYKRKDMKLLKDYTEMRLIWTHPLAMRLKEESDQRTLQRKKTSYRSSISDEEESDTTESYPSSDSSVMTTSSEEDGKRKTRRKTSKKKRSPSRSPKADSKVRRGLNFPSSDDEGQQEEAKKYYRRICSVLSSDENEEIESPKHQRGSIKDNVRTCDNDEPATNNSDGAISEEEDGPWWREFISDEEMEDYNNGQKVPLLLTILEECEKMGDKLLVFSQSLASLDVIEFFLRRSDELAGSQSQDYVAEWNKGIDYFRLEGKTSKEDRAKFCDVFNDRKNTRARLFLISTKAGGLGINLTAANRVVIFDNSWNPSSDIQSIFRIYRFGQTKPCFVYRLVTQATMEEKIFERQITKLSNARRILDEEQIDRIFTREEVGDLYAFNRIVPGFNDHLVNKSFGDSLMRRLVKTFPKFVIDVHEHDSFLVKNDEEDLTEEERRMADEVLGQSQSEDAALRGAIDVKEKIRSGLTQISASSNGDSAPREEEVKKLHEKLVQFYENERKKQLQWSTPPNPFKKSIPTDRRDKPNGVPDSHYHDRRRPIFGMVINKVREVMRDPERLLIEQRALLHMLRLQSDGRGKIPSTWVLTCPGKDAAALETIFRSEFAHWWSFIPVFGSVGEHLILHFEITLRRDTLENALGKHRIKVDYVCSDIETAQSLLGPSYYGRTENGGALASDDDGSDDDDDDDDNSDEYHEDNVSESDSGDEWPSDQKPYVDEDQTRKMTKSFILS